MGKTMHPNAKKEEKPRGFFRKLKDDRDCIVRKISQVFSNIDRGIAMTAVLEREGIYYA
jgi:hypothetical protein